MNEIWVRIKLKASKAYILQDATLPVLMTFKRFVGAFDGLQTGVDTDEVCNININTSILTMELEIDAC